MDQFLFYAHSGLRWLAVLMTFVAFIWLTVGLSQNRPFDKRTHLVVVIWSSLVGLQWLLGLLLWLLLGGFDIAHRWEHLVTMTLALAVAHAYVPLKKRPDRVRYQGVLLSIGAALVLIFVGVARLPQGWTFEVSWVDGDAAEVEDADDDAATFRPDAPAIVLVDPAAHR